MKKTFSAMVVLIVMCQFSLSAIYKENTVQSNLILIEKDLKNISHQVDLLEDKQAANTIEFFVNRCRDTLMQTQDIIQSDL